MLTHFNLTPAQVRAYRRRAALLLAFWSGLLGLFCALTAFHLCAFLQSPNAPDWKFLVCGGMLAGAAGMVVVYSRRI